MTRPTLEQWRRYAPEAGDVVAWEPRGREPISGRPYEVLEVEGDLLRLRDRLFGDSHWEEPDSDRGAYFVLETAEERMAKELMQ
ncbi:MAG TPA: hypothetical protein VMZ50_08425 [Phycisphaerae bacterium]|nr:hypothetical protein [Phycisphaerae bacterium]